METNLFPLIHLIIAKGASVTSFEWKYGKVPTSIEQPSSSLIEMVTNEEATIDFGDSDTVDEPIDFGVTDNDVEASIDISIVADEKGN